MGKRCVCAGKGKGEVSLRWKIFLLQYCNILLIAIIKVAGIILILMIF